MTSSLTTLLPWLHDPEWHRLEYGVLQTRLFKVSTIVIEWTSKSICYVAFVTFHPCGTVWLWSISHLIVGWLLCIKKAVGLTPSTAFDGVQSMYVCAQYKEQIFPTCFCAAHFTVQSRSCLPFNCHLHWWLRVNLLLKLLWQFCIDHDETWYTWSAWSIDVPCISFTELTSLAAELCALKHVSRVFDRLFDSSRHSMWRCYLNVWYNSFWNSQLNIKILNEYITLIFLFVWF